MFEGLSGSKMILAIICGLVVSFVIISSVTIESVDHLSNMYMGILIIASYPTYLIGKQVGIETIAPLLNNHKNK